MESPVATEEAECTGDAPEGDVTGMARKKRANLISVMVILHRCVLLLPKQVFARFHVQIYLALLRM
jgi:hypothetical protein